ncbi:MAG TPA: hypothetical protein VEC38_10310 [Candidatus Binataceae bacterium]|nr:hypothetical protein [Candidatus Binataceae bacterium]
MVNRAEVLEATCSACGSRFAASPTGDKTLVATIGEAAAQNFFFCGACGENIMGRVQREDARSHYGWDWAVPLSE